MYASGLLTVSQRKLRTAVSACFSLFLFLQSPASLHAELEQATDDTAAKDKDRFFKPGGVSVAIYAGDFLSAEEEQFTALRAEYSLGLGISADLNKIPHLALDFELLGFNREYTTPVLPPELDDIDNDTKITTNTYLFGARAYYQVRDPLRLYAVFGFGYFETRMLATGERLGLPATHEDTEWSFNLYAGAGIIYMFDRWGLGLDYRYFDLEGDFSDFEVDGANVGGEAIMLGLRYRF